MNKLKFTLLGLAALLALPAQATLMLAANVNGVLFNCVDQTACDTNPLVGQLGIANQTFNGVEIIGSSQFSITGPTNFLNTASFQIVNHNLSAASIALAIGNTNFVGPTATFAASGSGTWQNANGSNLTLLYFGDAANTQPATSPGALPGIQLATFSDTAVGPADAFSFNTSGPFLTGLFYSMSLGTQGVLAAWNGQVGQEPTLVGRSQTIITNQVALPEPGSLALLGIAALGLGFIRRKA